MRHIAVRFWPVGSPDSERKLKYQFKSNYHYQILPRIVTDMCFCFEPGRPIQMTTGPKLWWNNVAVLGLRIEDHVGDKKFDIAAVAVQFFSTKASFNLGRVTELIQLDRKKGSFRFDRTRGLLIYHDHVNIGSWILINRDLRLPVYWWISWESHTDRT